MSAEYKTTFNYLLTHRAIPRLMFSDLDFFYQTVLPSPQNMQTFMQIALKNATEWTKDNQENIEPAYPVEEFKMSIFGDSLEKSIIIVKIPRCEKICDCIEIAFPTTREHARYFTCELSISNFVLGEWTPDGTHRNFGAIAFEEEKDFSDTVVDLVYGKQE